MKNFVTIAAFAAGANAFVGRSNSCCFHMKASGGASGSIGQLDDGQNRIGGGLSEAQFCIDSSSGTITDANGRGCIVTGPTTQFQCDEGATPTQGFSINSQGEIEFKGDSDFVACETGQNGGLNLYTTESDDVTGCKNIHLSADSCGGGAGAGASSSAFPSSSPIASTTAVPVVSASSSSVPAGGASTPVVPGGGASTPSVPGGGATPSVPGGGESTPSVPGGGGATPSVPGGGEGTPSVPGGGGATPSVPGGGAIPSVPGGGASTPSVPGGGGAQPTETPSVPVGPGAGGAESTTVIRTTMTTTYCPESSSVPGVPGVPGASGTPGGPGGAGAHPSGTPSVPGGGATVQPTVTPSVPGGGGAQPSGTPSVPGVPGASGSQSVPGGGGAQPSGTPSVPGGGGAQPSASSSGGASCPTNLSGDYEYPHLIIPIDSSSPDKAAGTQFNGTVSQSVSTIFNFDIPSSDQGKTCSLVFLFPELQDLETSSYSFSGDGKVDFAALSGVATQKTSYNNAPKVSKDLGQFTLSRGNSYLISSFSCPAGQAVSYEMKNAGSTNLEFFEDYNPSPLGLYITVC